MLRSAPGIGSPLPRARVLTREWTVIVEPVHRRKAIQLGFQVTVNPDGGYR
jgi:hypothetical protein